MKGVSERPVVHRAPTNAPTTGALIKAGIVTNERVDAAVAAILADLRTGRFAIAEGLHVDLAAIVRRSRHARVLLKDPDATEGLKRGTFRKAILLAHPVKA